jgi:hypothetical protein
VAFSFLLWLEEKAEAGCPAPLFTPNRNHVPGMSISIRVRPASFAADIHITGIFIHIAGIRIHIAAESLSTSLRNQYSHRPEYAAKLLTRVLTNNLEFDVEDENAFWPSRENLRFNFQSRHQECKGQQLLLELLSAYISSWVLFVVDL